jgi:hypothetical protein
MEETKRADCAIIVPMDDTDAQPVRGTFRRFASFQAMRDDQDAYWDSRPAHERLTAAGETAVELYRMRGELPNVSGLRGPSISPK